MEVMVGEVEDHQQATPSLYSVILAQLLTKQALPLL
jgi:hypothetical protein